MDIRTYYLSKSIQKKQKHKNHMLNSVYYTVGLKFDKPFTV